MYNSTLLIMDVYTSHEVYVSTHHLRFTTLITYDAVVCAGFEM